jgi:hypothetical protein
MTELRDGTVGFLQRRIDDCLQAAIASCAQISPYLVPDLNMEQQTAAGKDPEEVVSASLAKLGRWMDENGVAIRFHASPPWSARRWIGVIRDPRPLSDHCLLMSGGSACSMEPRHCRSITMSRRVTMILRILITESQSSQGGRDAKEDAAWEQRTFNADEARIKAGGPNPVPGATIPLTAAGLECGEVGKKLVEAVRAEVDRATDGQ